MDILVYRYGSICEPDIISAFRQAGLSVIEEASEITSKKISNTDRVLLVENILKSRHPLFVFSINFYPAIAHICNLYKTPYLCWTVDSPVPELFESAITLDTNRVFLFDQAQFRSVADYNPHIYHLPLASATDRFSKVIGSIHSSDIAKYSSDISFVGSLYTEKDPLHDMSRFPDYLQGYVAALTEASLKIYGYYPMEDILTDDILAALRSVIPHFYQPASPVIPTDRYIVANSYMGYHVAAVERTRTLNKLAEHFKVDLYTNSGTSELKNVHAHGTVQTLTEMPKVFHLSRINLNMTLKSIQTGLPLRIFDILGCGGFLMTNFQPELTDYFEIGVDMEAYSSLDELIDKCDYYLSHEEERQAIAYNGYEKVTKYHTYIHRISAMLGTLS